MTALYPRQLETPGRDPVLDRGRPRCGDHRLLHVARRTTGPAAPRADALRDSVLRIPTDRAGLSLDANIAQEVVRRRPDLAHALVW
jgi:hypothetical protein